MTNSQKKPKLLFYCQHLLGVGHVTRSLALSHELVERFDVTFLQGGPDIGKTVEHTSFQHLFLPPFLMRESDSSLYDPLGASTVEDIFSKRQQHLFEIASKTSFDVVLTELFPFGRNKFRKEILNLVSDLRKKNPKILVACSLRDILVEKSKPGFTDKVIQTVKGIYSCVLVHSDSDFLKLEDSFPAATQISDQLIYTGFVTEKPVGNPNSASQPPTRRPEVLVSQGGGSVGEEMSLAVARTAALLPHLKFRFILGPYAPSFLGDELLNITSGLNNVEVLGFLNNFEEELRTVALSVSLAGYNTVMNAFNTRTMALVYPYQANFEQTLRGEKLESSGALKMIYPTDLEPFILRDKILANLNRFPEDFHISLDGARRTAEILLAKLIES